MPDQKGHPLLSGGRIIPKDKIVTAEEAVRLIRDGATVATGGFVGIGFAEAIAVQIEQQFLEQGRPRDLTLMYAAGQGDGKEQRPQPFRSQRAGPARHRRALGPVPQAPETRHRQRDRSLQPSPGRHQPPVPRHRRRQAGHHHPRRHRHLRRSAPRRRQDQRRHDRGHRRNRHTRAARNICSTRRARSMSRSCAAPAPTPTATSRWRRRRWSWKRWRSPRRPATPAASSSSRSSASPKPAA